MSDAVLVTGVAGLIGREVVRVLAAAGHRIVAADHIAPADLPADVPFLLHALPGPGRWHEAIVRHRITRVIHAGGVSGPMVMPDDPARVCDINLAGLIGLLEAARIHGLSRIVWFSSILAYGPRPNLEPVPEDVVLAPDTVYGATKVAGEALVRAYHAEHGVDAVALRVASCYGPGRTTACLVRTLVEDALAGRPTAVRDEPGVTRQHVYLGDVAAAVAAALEAPALSQRAYNVGPGRPQTLAEIAAAVPGARVEVRPDGMAWNTFGLGPLTIDAARRDLGFEPRTGLAEGAARTRDWVEARRAT